MNTYTILLFFIAQAPVLAISNFKVVQTTTQFIEVSWSRINDVVDNYNLTCSPVDGGAPSTTTHQTCIGQSCVEHCTGLTAGTEYSIVLIAYNGSAVTSTQDTTAKTNLAKTTSLHTAATTTTLRVQWQAGNGNKDGFFVTCIPTDGGAAVTTAHSLSTLATCIGLTPGSSYSIVVTTIKEGWMSVNSTEIVTKKTLLAPVTNLKITQSTTTSLQISWTKAAGSQHGYSIVCRSSSFTKTVPISSGDIQSGTCTGLSPGYSYTGTVSTIKTSWSDVSSNSISGKTNLDIVQGITIGDVTSSTIFVSWQHATGGHGQYKLTCSPIDREQASTRENYYSGTSGTCSGLYGATKYNITVTTTQTGWSLSATAVGAMAKTIPKLPSSASLTPLSSTSAQISWMLPESYDNMVHNIKVYDMGRLGTSPEKLHSNISRSISGTNYRIDGLEEFWYYRCSVQITANGVTSQTRTTSIFRTNTAAPGPVHTLSIGKPSGRNVSVVWYIPKETDWNGVIAFYTLQIIDSESLTIRSVPYNREELVEGQKLNFNFRYNKTVPKLPSGNLTFEVWATTISDTGNQLLPGTKVQSSIIMEEGSLSSEQSAVIGLGIFIGIILLLFITFILFVLSYARKNELGFFKRTKEPTREMSDIYDNDYTITPEAEYDNCAAQRNDQPVYENCNAKTVDGATIPAATVPYSYLNGSNLPKADIKVDNSPPYENTKMKQKIEKDPDSRYVNQAMANINRKKKR